MSYTVVFTSIYRSWILQLQQFSLLPLF